MIYSLKDMSDGWMQAMDQGSIEGSMHQGDSEHLEGQMDQVEIIACNRSGSTGRTDGSGKYHSMLLDGKRCSKV